MGVENDPWLTVSKETRTSFLENKKQFCQQVEWALMRLPSSKWETQYIQNSDRSQLCTSLCRESSYAGPGSLRYRTELLNYVVLSHWVCYIIIANHRLLYVKAQWLLLKRKTILNNFMYERSNHNRKLTNNILITSLQIQEQKLIVYISMIRQVKIEQFYFIFFFLWNH